MSLKLVIEQLNDLFKAIREELNENNVVYNKDLHYTKILELVM